MNKVITFGEVMLRLSSPDYSRLSQTETLQISVGGGEANVAISLANYGIDVEFITRLPKNDLGDLCLKNLKKNNVNVQNVIWGGDRLGTYYHEKGAVSRGGKVIYDRNNSAFSSIEPGMINWDQIFEGVSWFHWTGISAGISESAAKVCLEAITSANKKRITVSVDINYRANLWKYGKAPINVMPELVDGCDIIIGNEMDAEKILGIPSKSLPNKKKLVPEDYSQVFKSMMSKYPRCKKIISTIRGSINANYNTLTGVLHNGDDFIKASNNYNITHIVDRIGGGDSFMGGLIYGLITWPEDDQKALDFALAASFLKHTICGDYNQVSINEIEKVLNGNKTGYLIR
ncbi:sugar kinase [Marinifilum caeruleilacunae]|uniref:Sugar kinase n=1 Tax=Marinifilum caeruleilacunae TaxID=2499076 RepID=A0ABX1WZ20_9BACT|nr:sugar kinase [Marinifilum caeruleilacunae]NOU61314.1 sugar kinase [Marinifilum caeruleilacunae]